MKVSSPNLFQALFDFHPRDDHTPKENFLTEAFAYLLQSDRAVLTRWLSILLDKKDTEDAICEVMTRQAEKNLDADTLVFPDLLLDGQLSNGERFAIYCEHKWDSPCNKGQLTRYRKMANSKGAHASLAFVGANQTQRSDAKKCFKDDFVKCFLWEDIFNALDGLPAKSPILQEFLSFMKTQGLSPGQPLTIERMTAFLQVSDFIKSLLNLANKLHTNYSWDVVPKRFRDPVDSYVRNHYGRVGIRFETPEWRPALAVGFLYDETDHKVTLVNRSRGIDLLLRIEAFPKDTKSIKSALDVLDVKRKELKKTAASALLKGERGNGNAYSVLIVQECLGDVIEDAKTESDQLAAIHKRLTTWLHVLFDDGSLENGFKASKLDSGMM